MDKVLKELTSRVIQMGRKVGGGDDDELRGMDEDKLKEIARDMCRDVAREAADDVFKERVGLLSEGIDKRFDVMKIKVDCKADACAIEKEIAEIQRLTGIDA